MYRISGMHCNYSAEKIKNTLLKMSEVTKVTVAFNSTEATIEMSQHRPTELPEFLNKLEVENLSRISGKSTLGRSEE